MVDNGADIKHQRIVTIPSKFQDGWTTLHYTASNGHFKCLKLLIKNGADINQINEVSIVAK